MMPSNKKKSRNNEFLSKKFSNKFLKYYLFRILLYIFRCFFLFRFFAFAFFDEKQKYICAHLEISRQNYVSFHASLITKYYFGIVFKKNSHKTK